MNRGDIIPFQKIGLGRQTTTKDPERSFGLHEVTFRVLSKRGRELTEQTASAEREGDIRRVEQLKHKKDQLHRLRRELSAAGC